MLPRAIDATRVTSTELFAALGMLIGSLAAGWVFLHSSRRMFSSPSLMKKNFRGAEIPTAGGLIFAPTFLVAWVAVSITLSRPFSVLGEKRLLSNFSLAVGMQTMLILVIGMSLVGFIDDVAGDGGARGFKGHISEAMSGRFTTGLFKAVMGFVVALAATAKLVILLYPSTPLSAYGKWVLDAALIALAANFFNLLDLRPGRALKAFFPLLILVIVLSGRFGVVNFGDRTQYIARYLFVVPAFSIAAVAILLFPGDMKEKFMIGDSGANVLGAVIGLGLVLGLSFWWRLGVLIFLVFLTALSEKFSFSRVIEGNRVLNWLDELGRKRRDTA